MDTAQAQLFSQDIIRQGEIAGWIIDEYVAHGKSAVLFSAHSGAASAIVKVFHPGLIEAYGRESQVIRVNRERELVGRHHPNIVRVLDAGSCEQTGHLYVVMEKAAGAPLSKRLTHVPRDRISMLVEQLARAAMQLEDWGFTHRDIKPDNIHIDDECNVLTLLDFGVIKPHGNDSATSLFTNKPFVGTHQYSPPEMIHGQEEDTIDGWRAVTFYQIGAVMHDLITGTPIFEGATSRNADLVRAIDNDQVAVHADDIPSSICSVATRCLLKVPGDRLNLLAWQDFMFSEANDASLSLQARAASLSRRVGLGKSNRGDLVLVREEQRLKGIQVEQIVRAARGRFDQVLCDLGPLVPSRRTSVLPAAHPEPGVIYTFERAPEKGFDVQIRIEIAIQLHDSRDTVDVYVRASKGAEDTGIGWSHLGPALRTLEGFDIAFKEWIIGVIEEFFAERDR